MTSQVETNPTIQLSEREVVLEIGTLADADATVCVTLYDYEDFVLEALESAYSQTLDALGLVVVDDASTDAGLSRVERWMRISGNRFAGACLARHRRNSGLAHARNGAIDLALSEFVMVLDADNHLYPRCVERLLQSLEASDHGFAYPIIERFGARSGLMGTSSFSSELLRETNYIDAMALLRKTVWKRLGGYQRMSVAGWEDYDLWCRCVEAGIAGLLVPEILARYRTHDSSMLAQETDRGENALSVRREMQARHPWLRLIDRA